MEVPDSPGISRNDEDTDARLVSQKCTIDPGGGQRLRRCTTRGREERRAAHALETAVGVDALARVGRGQKRATQR